MQSNRSTEWKVSLHGGHSGSYCDHASGTLREVLEAAVAAGYATFGVSEHAPRAGERFLYEEERKIGWDIARLEKNFEGYAKDLEALAPEFDGRLEVLRGFEIEVVPDDRYADLMLEYRRKFGFEYMVGSVHHVHETLIDGPVESFEHATDICGGLEALGVAYYRSVARMVEALRPEVVGHLDLIRKNAPDRDAVETPRIRDEALKTLDTIKTCNGILDLNTAGYRKGLGSPYPAAWLVRAASEMEIDFCFGDDSHGPADVGAGIEDARNYLLENGVTEITALARADGTLVHRKISIT